MKGLIGKKVGMTQLYDEAGKVIPVTVIEAGPCPVIEQRTAAKNGYSALQLGFGSRKAKNVLKPVQGQLAKAGLTEGKMPSIIREIRLDADPQDAVGSELTVTIFNPAEFVDVVGVTKGRGFQGVVKRFKFKGGRYSHGGGWKRKPGSMGQRELPGKLDKGKRLPGHMGNDRRTVQNLKLVRIDAEDNLLFVKGAIPGPNGGIVMVREARKKPAAAAK